jgi:predicted dehydrogenase
LAATSYYNVTLFHCINGEIPSAIVAAPDVDRRRLLDLKEGNRPVKVGIIGASFAKAAYLPALRLVEGAEVLAVASARLASARLAADQFAVPHAYDDWRRMLAEHRFDLVCVATPTVTHAPMVLAALDAGAHVLAEKPTAMNAAEAESMLHRAEALGRLHMIDHELRFNARRRHIKHLIDNGAVGKVRHVSINIIGSSWGDPASRPENDWWSLAEQGGGRLGANGSHQVDLLRWWFGEISAVSGQVRTLIPNRLDRRTGRAWTATADDHVHFHSELAQGIFASVLLSTVARHGLANDTSICGSEGTITLNNDSERLFYAPAGEPMTEIDVPDPYRNLDGINPGIWNQSVVGALTELCSAIMECRPLREGATFLDGLRNQRVLDAIRESEQQRRWVDLPS